MKKALIALMMFSLIGVGTAFAQDDRNESKRDDMREKIEDRMKDKRSGTPITFTVEQTACLKTALSKREDMLIGGHTTYSTAITKAFSDRKVALLAAMDKAPAERRAAVKVADKAFGDTTKIARKAWSESRRTAWNTFTTERKACFGQTTTGTASASDTGSSKTDAAL